MTDILKNKSLFAYVTISFLIIFSAAVTVFFIQGEQKSGNTIYIAGKQSMIVQRVALLSNNLFYEVEKKGIKKKIQNYLKELKQNQSYIKSLNNSIANNLFYDSGYQYDNLLKQYMSNIEKFIQNPTSRLLKIINFTNESLLTTTTTLVTLLADERDRQIQSLIYILIATTTFLLFSLYLIYINITLVSISQTQNNIQELDNQKSFMSAVLENSAHAIIATEIDGTITLFNKKAEEMLGYTREEMISKNTPAVFHLDEEVIQRAKLLSEEFKTNIEPGFQVFVEKSTRNLPNKDEWIYVTKDGKKLTVKLSITAIRDFDQVITGYLGIAEDISILKDDEKKIKEYVNLIDKNIITSSTDLNGKIIYTSEAFCKISGYSKEELIGKNHSIVRHPDMSKEVYKDLWNHLVNDKEWSGEIKNRKKDGGFYWVRANISPNYDVNGNKIGYTAIRQDITDAKLIEKISITDGLTDIYNRRHFDDIFPKMIKNSKRSKDFVSFLIMDVDHFKQYNDTYGHQMGDNVLIEIAKAIKKSLKRQDDLCFRLGGEEFGVVFNSDNKYEALEFANKIKQDIEDLKIEHEKNTVSKYVTASMGLICLKRNQVESEDLIYREADSLLYKAKEQGRNRVISED